MRLPITNAVTSPCEPPMACPAARNSAIRPPMSRNVFIVHSNSSKMKKRSLVHQAGPPLLRQADRDEVRFERGCGRSPVEPCGSGQLHRQSTIDRLESLPDSR